MGLGNQADGDTNNVQAQDGQSEVTGSGAKGGGTTADNAIGDFGNAVGATGSGGPNPFGGSPGSTGGPTLDNLVDRDLARESPAGPGTSTTGADIGPVST